MTYNIDVHTSKKILQYLKCMRLKKSIYPKLSIINEKKEKEKKTNVKKEKEEK